MIHHYTSIDCLALILSSRKIRFSRVDRLDDVTESTRHAEIPVGQYFFVTCWTQQDAESIPQWHMYTDRMEGVRLSLPDYPFQQKLLAANPAWNTVSSGQIYSPLSLDEILGKGHFVVPTFLGADDFGGRVEYRGDIESRYKEAIVIERSNGRFSIRINKPFDLVRLKRPEWQFQEEYRFALLIVPSIPLPPGGPGNEQFATTMPTFVGNCMLEGRPPEIDYIDIDLSDEALAQLKITTGPKCSKGSKVAIRALADRYAPGSEVTESQFTGSIR